MAMIIAWQTVNALRRPASRQFTRGFLIVAPGLTVKDRLRVLQPNDPNSYYTDRKLVPGIVPGCAASPEDLKNTGKGNLFVIIGEPDITLLPEPDGRLRIKVNGVDVFRPQTGEVVSDGADGIACWFIDTDYNQESFFVRHAYFLGANDPYSALKTTLKAEIDVDAWATLNATPHDRLRNRRTGGSR